MLGQQRMDVGQAQRRHVALPRRRRVDPRGRRVDPRELGRELRELPGLVASHLGQAQHSLADRLDPVGRLLARAQSPQHAPEAVDELRESAGEIDVGAVEIVQRQRRAEMVVIAAVQRRADDDPIDTRAPRVLAEAAQVVVVAMLLVEPPADGDLLDPVGHAVEVVIGEAEPASDRGRLRQVEHLAGREPTAGEDDEARRELQERIRLPRCAVGESHPQPVCRVAVRGHRPHPGRTGRRAGRSVDRVAYRALLRGQQCPETEARVHERGEGLDVGTHDEDVARLEGGVVREQPGDDVAEHVDLSGGAVTGVDLDRPVALAHHAVGPVGVVGLVVGTQVGLEPLEQGRCGIRGRLLERLVGRPRHGEGALQLARVAPQPGEQRMSDELDAAIQRSRHRAGRDLGGDRLPPGGGGLGEPDVDVAMLGECREQLGLAAGDPRVPEEGEPPRQIERGCTRVRAARAAGAQGRDDLGVAHIGRRCVDERQDAPPQVGLPREVGLERAARTVGCAAGPCAVEPRAARPSAVGATPGADPLGHGRRGSLAAEAPVGEQGRSLQGVGGEQAGEAAGHGVAASAAQIVGRAVVPQVRREGGRPRFVERFVDGAQDRPGEAIGMPRIVVRDAEHEGDERVRVEEADSGAHPVLPAGGGAEPMREPLGEPAFHPLGGHRDDLLGERIGQRCREQVGEAVGQEARSGGAMQVEAHVGDDNRPHRQGCAGRARRVGYRPATCAFIGSMALRDVGGRGSTSRVESCRRARRCRATRSAGSGASAVPSHTSRALVRQAP